MNIYIDESGIFNNPTNKQNIASCVGALCIPSCKRSAVVKEFNQLKSLWGIANQEAKGKELDEKKISQVIEVLKRYDVVFKLIVTDLGLLTDQEISDFKGKSARGMTIHLTPEHPVDTIAKAQEWEQQIEKMSNQLFVQMELMRLLIPDTVQDLVLYYARRMPKELGKFHWVVDAKDKHPTTYENVLAESIYSFVSTYSSDFPLMFAEGGDYSYFKKGHKESKTTLEVRAKEDVEYKEKGHATLSVKKVLGGGFIFEDSKKNNGLQLVDILVNAAQRAFNDKLQPSGWKELGALLIEKHPSSISFIGFNVNEVAEKYDTIQSPFYHVVDTLNEKAKSIWTMKEKLAARRKRNNE